MSMTPQEIANKLIGYRFRFSTELELHLAISEALAREGIDHVRECRLSLRDRLDFYLFGEIALEVKIKGRAAEILRQLERYAEADQVHGLVLVTTRRLHAAQMPFELNGKELACCLISGGL
jgi:hypothetical protein